MDARIRRPSHPDPGRIDVRIDDLGELAASIPHLLGFRPRESVVLVGLAGPAGGRVGLTVRADIPLDGHAGAVTAALTRGCSPTGPGECSWRSSPRPRTTETICHIGGWCGTWSSASLDTPSRSLR